MLSNQPTPDQDYFIQSQLNAQFASLYGANVGEDTNIATYAAVGDINNQLWTFEADADGDYYYIVSEANNLVMGLYYGGPQVRTQAKASSNSDQQWKLVEDGSIMFIESRAKPGQVLTIVPGTIGGTTVNWVELEEKKTIGNANQEWKLKVYSS